MNNCSKHKKEVAGIYSMPELAQMIADLHYQTLSDLLINLAAKIKKDADKDRAGGREQLAYQLTMLSNDLYAAEQHALNVWNICKPFMKNETTENNNPH